MQAPDQDLRGRDGGTRTRDLSVPNAAGSNSYGPWWTKTQAAPAFRTPMDSCDLQWTRDKRGIKRISLDELEIRCSRCKGLSKSPH